MRQLALVLSIPVLAALLACDGDLYGPTSRACNLSIEASLVESEGTWTVEYKATLTGQGSLSSLTFSDADGATQTVASPSLPFTQSISVPGGRDVAMTAQGEVLDGEIVIRLDGSVTAAGQEATVQDIQTCAHSG